MVGSKETLEELKGRMGRAAASLLTASASGRPVRRRLAARGYGPAPLRRNLISDERLLRVLAKQISRLMAEDGRRGVGSP